MASQSVYAPPGTMTGYDWTARIRCIPSELRTNFYVYIFLGPIPEPPTDLITHPNYVGSFYTYSNTSTSAIAKQRSQGGSSSHSGSLVEGFVNLSRALVERGGFQTLEPENVVPYLKNNLNWCLEKGIERVNLHDLPSLEVMVLEMLLTQGPEDDIPKMGPPKEHPAITRGKEGGAK
ncbi:hypothetical protein FRC00_010514 [Tulasnella sp. 408]|nr:hypothetical protein FRC00_010514 [Tulasnella sp. 408]